MKKTLRILCLVIAVILCMATAAAEDLTLTIACLMAALEALQKGDDPERTTLLKQKQVLEVSMAMALDKLKDML